MLRSSAQYQPVWREWRAGCREAAERGLPVLVSLDPAWTTAGQRLDLVAGREPALQCAFEERCVPVRVDPLDRPDLETRFQDVCRSFSGVVGPPCLVLLAPEGEVLLPFTSLSYEGNGEGIPSLASVIEAAGEVSPSDVKVEGAVGGDECAMQCQPDPRVLMPLVERARSNVAARDRLRGQLDVILSGGVRDQIGRGFHAAGRDDRMIVPFFEKPLTQNAGMAAVLARAAEVLADDGLVRIADQTAAFVVEHLDRDPDAQAIAADSHYYTWMPKEFSGVVPPQISKTAALHFNITLAEVPHVLFAAQDADAIAGFGNSDAQQIAREIEEAKMMLVRARRQRPSPEVISKEATNRTAETLGWLAVAKDAGCSTVESEFLMKIWKQHIQPRVRSTGETRHDNTGNKSYVEDTEAVRRTAQVLGI